MSLKEDLSKLRNKISTKLKDEGGGVKSKTGINLLGQTRNVKKFYDEDGAYLGKEVRVVKGDGTAKRYGGGVFGPRLDQDVKIKVPNPGLMETGGFGKLRKKKGYFDKEPIKKQVDDNVDLSQLDRPEFAYNQEELKHLVKTDGEGNKSLATYTEAWNDSKRFKIEGDKKINLINPDLVYPNTEQGFLDFIDDSKKYWAYVADRFKNKKLLIDSQTGKEQTPPRKEE